MPSAHFREFNGIAPRIRGESSNAKECVNVDLYGRTIRPYADDALLSEPKQNGRFVRIEGNLHFIAGAIDIQLQTFKGYHVVLYRTSKTGKWFKKVFDQPHAPTAKITPVGFPPPTLPESNVTLPWSSTAGSIDVTDMTKGMYPYAYQEGSLGPLPPDKYKYFVEAVHLTDGREDVIFRTPDWEYNLEYESFRENTWGDFNPRESKGPIYYSFMDEPYPQTTIVNAFVKLYGYAGHNGELYTGHGEEWKSYRIGTNRLPSQQSPLDPNGLPFIPRWRYGVNSRGDKLAYNKLTQDSINDLQGVVTISINDKSCYANAVYIGGYFYEEGKSVATQGSTVIHDESKSEYPIQGLRYGVQFKVPDAVDIFTQNRVRRREKAGGSAVVVNNPRTVKYRLYRQASADTVPYMVNEVVADAEKNVQLYDNNPDLTQGGSGQIQRAKDEKTYRYITTLSRVAGIPSDPSKNLDAWVEESGPSNDIEIVGYSPTFIINRPQTDNVEYDKWNIYRITEGVDGTEDFQLVAEVDKAESSYHDKIQDTALGPVPESSFINDAIPYVYEDMPNGLQLATGPYNGMTFGWKEGSLYWTDRYYLSGWSSTFNAEMPAPIVNVVPLGNAMAIITTDGVYRAVSSQPTDFSFVESPSGEGGRAGLTDSVIPSDKGVIYLSDSGIHAYDGVRSVSMTDTLVGEEYFRSDLDLSKAILRENDGILHLFHGGGAVLFDTRSKQISTIDDLIVTEVFRDHSSGSLLAKNSDGRIYELFTNPVKSRSMTYRTGEVHFGRNGRKRVKYIQFLGAGKVQCTPFINGSEVGLKPKLINMDGMENDTRIYLPNSATLDSLELELTGHGEVEEFTVMWERM